MGHARSAISRRRFLLGVAALGVGAQIPARAETDPGQRLAQAARAQIGVTLGYDPRYVRIPYPNGDVPRSTGVCADVIIRAARDALRLDLQRLVHEDMLRAFAAYPAQRAWGSREPDTNIDHRRVLNLETYWQREGARLWAALAAVAGDAFPKPLAVGDLVTWRLWGRLPHVAIVVESRPDRERVAHNIGNGAEEIALDAFREHRAAGLFRWPGGAGADSRA